MGIQQFLVYRKISGCNHRSSQRIFHRHQLCPKIYDSKRILDPHTWSEASQWPFSTWNFFYIKSACHVDQLKRGCYLHLTARASVYQHLHQISAAKNAPLAGGNSSMQTLTDYPHFSNRSHPEWGGLTAMSDLPCPSLLRRPSHHEFRFWAARCKFYLIDAFHFSIASNWCDFLLLVISIFSARQMDTILFATCHARCFALLIPWHCASAHTWWLKSSWRRLGEKFVETAGFPPEIHHSRRKFLLNLMQILRKRAPPSTGRDTVEATTSSCNLFPTLFNRLPRCLSYSRFQSAYDQLLGREIQWQAPRDQGCSVSQKRIFA